LSSARVIEMRTPPALRLGPPDDARRSLHTSHITHTHTHTHFYKQVSTSLPPHHSLVIYLHNLNVLSRRIRRGTARRCTARYGTVRYGTIRHGTVPCVAGCNPHVAARRPVRHEKYSTLINHRTQDVYLFSFTSWRIRIKTM